MFISSLFSVFIFNQLKFVLSPILNEEKGKKRVKMVLVHEEIRINEEISNNNENSIIQNNSIGS